ncbi:MAG: HNH endonuclease [Alphaproteobacteria bacterium]|nr:HNH endonuclease [Alphaproteobacteria bacterium]
MESHALIGEILTTSELTTKVSDMVLDIKAGNSKIGEFTWHHHQELGRMELIPGWIHKAARHTGGDSLWPRNPALKGK